MWKMMGNGPQGGSLWVLEVPGGRLFMFVPTMGSPSITYAPGGEHF